MFRGCFEHKYLNKENFREFLCGAEMRVLEVSWHRGWSLCPALGRFLSPAISCFWRWWTWSCSITRMLFSNAGFQFFHLSVYSAQSHNRSHCSLEFVPRGTVSLLSFHYHPSPSCLLSLNADKEKKMPVSQNNWVYRAPWSCKEAGEADEKPVMQWHHLCVPAFLCWLGLNLWLRWERSWTFPPGEHCRGGMA